LKPLGRQKAAFEARLVELTQERANLLEQLAKARSGRWSALGKAVKEVNKRLDGQLRVDFEPARIRDPLRIFLLNCQLDGVGDKRLSWIDAADSLSIPDLVAAIREGSNALQTRFKKVGMQKQAADALGALSAAKLRELEELYPADTSFPSPGVWVTWPSPTSRLGPVS
jgi:hypothetical protein